VSYIEELKSVIRKLHGAEPKHIESVPVKEVFNGQTVWDGVVEIFTLSGHLVASTVYAWTHDTDDPENPHRHVTVLGVHPIRSARDAVKAAIAQEFRSLEPTEEN
jgi:hypothetical protein